MNKLENKMSRKDTVLSTLEFFKAVVLALLTAIFGGFGYVIVHLYKIDFIQSIMVGVGAFVLVGVLGIVTRRVKKLLTELEEL